MVEEEEEEEEEQEVKAPRVLVGPAGGHSLTRYSITQLRNLPKPESALPFTGAGWIRSTPVVPIKAEEEEEDTRPSAPR